MNNLSRFARKIFFLASFLFSAGLFSFLQSAAAEQRPYFTGLWKKQHPFPRPCLMKRRQRVDGRGQTGGARLMAAAVYHAVTGQEAPAL
jgi:hypothetical protein